MNIRTVSIAQSEITDAYFFYSQISPTLAGKFLLDFEETTQRILNFPKYGVVYLHSHRRAFLKRFEYSIIYKIYPEIIIIIAVMHNKRKPDYWISRM